jgi:hypothetical protein
LKIIHQFADYFIWALMGLALAFVGFFVFDSLYPSKLLEFDYSMLMIDRGFTHSDVTPQVFNSGDVVPLIFRGKRNTDDVPLIITHLVYKDLVMTVASSKDNPELPAPRVGKGPFNFVSMSRKIPRNAPEGVAFFEMTYTFRRNFIRDVEIYKIRTEPFMVIPKKEVHDDAEDEALIRKILKEMRVGPGAIGPQGIKGDKGDTGEQGKRGPNLFGK